VSLFFIFRSESEFFKGGADPNQATVKEAEHLLGRGSGGFLAIEIQPADGTAQALHHSRRTTDSLRALESW
jgi:hypothetical protein